MNKIEVIQTILKERSANSAMNATPVVYAPTNIALCKYWGKRDAELNLPVTNSLSISLADKGATTLLQVSDHDEIILNDQVVSLESSFAKRLMDFLILFRRDALPLRITIRANIPIAAGLASSACGFASLIKALNMLYSWELSTRELSILARLGSGSACRSLWDGFVEWQAGERADGMDSYGELLNETWPELCVGLLLISEKEKAISSREAMKKTIETSGSYKQWPKKIAEDLPKLKQAIHEKEFKLLGETAESNAMMMHAMMLTSQPPIQYATLETLVMMQKIWNLRRDGFSIYFTQDAGPNLKLLFLERDVAEVEKNFPAVEVVRPMVARAIA